MDIVLKKIILYAFRKMYQNTQTLLFPCQFYVKLLNSPRFYIAANMDNSFVILHSILCSYCSPFVKSKQQSSAAAAVAQLRGCVTGCFQLKLCPGCCAMQEHCR